MDVGTAAEMILSCDSHMTVTAGSQQEIQAFRMSPPVKMSNGKNTRERRPEKPSFHGHI